MQNIELKAQYRDLEKARRIAMSLGARLLWKDHQEDTYFVTQQGKLKLRESGLNGSELLPYIKADQSGTKRSDYAKIPVADAALVKSLLTELLGKKLSVKKTREVFLIENVRVHLDEVVGLGNFLEFEAVYEDDTPEAAQREIGKLQELKKTFEISEADLLDGSYPDLLSQ